VATAIQLKIEGDRELIQRLERGIARQQPREIRKALQPAARIYRKSIRAEAPVGETKMLRKSVVIRSSKRGPTVFVAVDRKKALRVSAAFPNGFPYVNSVISEKRRGAKADKFVARGATSAEAAGKAEALKGLRRLTKI